MNKVVFKIETIPDIEGGRRLYNLEGLTDKEVANVMFHKRRQETGSEFLRLHLHRIVSISVAQRIADYFAVYSLGDKNASEKDIIEVFFNVIEEHVPAIVSWNGNNFDFPVLHYRSLVHGVQAPRYWSSVEQNNEPGYLNHTDLMNVFAGNEAHANSPLNEVAILLGFPGNIGTANTNVWDKYREGDLMGIRSCCENNALNTYLVHLRYELISGHLTAKEYENECELVRSTLASENKPHLTEFLSAWQR